MKVAEMDQSIFGEILWILHILYHVGISELSLLFASNKLFGLLLGQKYPYGPHWSFTGHFQTMVLLSNMMVRTFFWNLYLLMYHRTETPPSNVLLEASCVLIVSNIAEG